MSCESCHGEVTGQHPPMPVPILADSEYCGSCHTTTLSEWHRSAHAAEDIGCMDCHDPHNQGELFETTDELCLNCHNEDERAEAYLEDLHVGNGVGCMPAFLGFIGYTSAMLALALDIGRRNGRWACWAMWCRRRTRRHGRRWRFLSASSATRRWR